jgi:dTDP-4-dehydrorhamnose 3,5-epimerase
VFDVAVDLRKDSPTFGQWVGEYLSEDNNRMLWVPPGFAHGFLVTSETADFQYKCTDSYAPEHERAIHWADVDLAIDWPASDKAKPIISQKDKQAVSFAQAEKYGQEGASI